MCKEQFEYAPFGVWLHSLFVHKGLGCPSRPNVSLRFTPLLFYSKPAIETLATLECMSNNKREFIKKSRPPNRFQKT